MSDEAKTKAERAEAKPTSRTPADTVRRAQSQRYFWGEELASGGMGVVQSVEDRALDRGLARKLLREELAQDESLAWMLVREARITARLAHPHVVPVHEIGVDDGDRIYFTMKRVEGRTLNDWVQERDPNEPINWSVLLDQLDVVIKVCDALAFAHSQGILHCDIKPANVMIGEFREVYLMDWGVAHKLGSEAAREGADEGSHSGTPQFMAPEQAMGDPLDVRSDVFAVGALLYFVVTQESPYRGKPPHVLVKASLGERKRVSQRAPWVPHGLARVIERAMAHEADARYQSIQALRDDLLRFLRGGDAFGLEVFETGETIVREGDHGDTAYIIERGRCAVTIAGDRVREMGPGEVFGEMAVLSSEPRTATVIALECTTVRTVSGDALIEEISSMKPWMASLVRTLADRLRDRG